MDDTDITNAPLQLSLEAGKMVLRTSDDLELSDTAKGLTNATGSVTGTWRPMLSSDELKLESNF